MQSELDSKQILRDADVIKMSSLQAQVKSLMDQRIIEEETFYYDSRMLEAEREMYERALKYARGTIDSGLLQERLAIIQEQYKKLLSNKTQNTSYMEQGWEPTP